MSWLTEQFSLLNEFLGSNFRRLVRRCAVGMLLAALLGFLASLLWAEKMAAVLDLIFSSILESGALDESGGLNPFALLMNNWRAMLTSALYGLIPFLFLPAFSLLINGAMVGMVGAMCVLSGLSPFYFLAGILPHGILELPALILSASCGVYLCRNMCRLVTSSPKRIPMTEVLGNLLRVLVMLVAPMTVAAAFIECYVTPAVMGLLS